MLKKKCKKCYGDGVLVHKLKPRLVKCRRCKGKGKVWRWKKR